MKINRGTKHQTLLSKWAWMAVYMGPLVGRGEGGSQEEACPQEVVRS